MGKLFTAEELEELRASNLESSAEERAKRAARQKKYYHAHLDQRRAYARAHYQANKEKINAQRRARYRAKGR